MEDKWQFRGLLIKVSVVVVTFFAIASIAAMTVYAANKVVITDSSEVEEEEIVETFVGNVKWKYELTSDNISEGKITIPINTETEQADIITDVRYIDKTISVSFASTGADYYKVNLPYGDFKGVKDAYGEFDGEKIRMIFSFKEPVVCEASYNSLIHGGECVLTVRPMNMPDKPVVLVDPNHGGAAAGVAAGDVVEKEVLLKIAKKVLNLSEDKPYDIVLMRTADTFINTEDRVKIVSMIKPDYYIGLELSAEVDNTKNFGMYATFNDGYYRCGIQNVDFADKILRSVCTEASNRGNGLMAAGDEDVILMTMNAPGTVLHAGYLSNPEECALLGSDEYLDKIARGIVDGLDQIIK